MNVSSFFPYSETKIPLFYIMKYQRTP